MARSRASVLRRAVVLFLACLLETGLASVPARADAVSPTSGAPGTDDVPAKDGARVLPNGAGELASVTLGRDLVWVIVGGPLLVLMQGGFALLGSGLTRAKNAAHTVAMGLVVYAVGVIGYWAIGFALQMGGAGPAGALDGMVRFELFGRPFDVLGRKGAFLAGDASDPAILTVFLFQVVFLVTATTVSIGALAERWRFASFLAYGLFMSAVIYPVYACWVWGGGWLADLGVNFGLGNGHVDFAGSSVVHMTGGLTALAGAMVLGPRIGKFRRDGTARAIPGHDIPKVVLGTLLLAFAWFGLNCATVLGARDVALASVAIATLLATAAGCCTSLWGTWLIYGKPDPTIGCNGLLAGAVAIAGPCAFVSPLSAVVIGGLAGAVVVGAVPFVERVLRVDDPVGAVSVHGVCGAFGCLCVGLFADGRHGHGWNGLPAGEAPLGLFYGGDTGQLLAGLIGVAANALWSFPVAWAFFKVLGATLGNRVSAQAEIAGLDVAEMGIAAYAHEEPIEVERAGLEHLAEHGPGVPRRVPAAVTDNHEAPARSR
jgi:Amt family ammonium transporter